MGISKKHQRTRRPGERGYAGPGGGAATYVQAPAEWRGTTVQVCGLWPFAVGASAPMIGPPFGRHLETGATVCFSPIAWFQQAKLIANPSVFWLSNPGLGKSSGVRHVITGSAAFGSIPLILGDTKPDYVKLVKELGGQVITLGNGQGYLNILDPGEAIEAAQLLRAHGFDDEADRLLHSARGRRETALVALLTVYRKSAPSGRETAVLSQALKWLDAHQEGVPVLADLLKVVQTPPPIVREVALDRGSMERYKEITENLEADLVGLTSGDRIGDVFAHPTTNPMRRDRAVVYDVSSIPDTDADLQAAALLACWSSGFGMIEVANALADAGLEPRRLYDVVTDEIWKVLASGPGMVARYNGLSRLNRARGVAIHQVSHTMKDLLALPTEAERQQAIGLIERSGVLVLGGLPPSEMPLINQAKPLTKAEENMVTAWQDPPEIDPHTGEEAEPPGLGLFLMKIGGRPGIPVRCELTSIELAASDTNQLWHEQSRVGERAY